MDDGLFLTDVHFVEGHGFVGVIHVGVFGERRPILAQSPDGLVWSELSVPGIPTTLTRTADLWVLTVYQRSPDGNRTNDFLAWSSDLDNWTMIELADLASDGEDVSFFNVAVSGDQLVMFGERLKDHPTRPKPPSSIVAAGRLEGPLKLKKAPLHTMYSVVEIPTGFVAVGHGARDRDRSRVFRSDDGLAWKEIAELPGWGQCVRFDDVLVAGGGVVMTSTDWGATWSPADLPSALFSNIIEGLSVGPAGVAVQLGGSTAPPREGQEFGDDMRSALWFSSDGVHYSEVDVPVGHSVGSATFLVAVGTDAILLTKRVYTARPTAEWIRVPIPE